MNNYASCAMQIGTLSRLIDSLGGKPELIAFKPGGEIRLKQFAGE